MEKPEDSLIGQVAGQPAVGHGDIPLTLPMGPSAHSAIKAKMQPMASANKVPDAFNRVEVHFRESFEKVK